MPKAYGIHDLIHARVQARLSEVIRSAEGSAQGAGETISGESISSAT